MRLSLLTLTAASTALTAPLQQKRQFGSTTDILHIVSGLSQSVSTYTSAINATVSSIVEDTVAFQTQVAIQAQFLALAVLLTSVREVTKGFAAVNDVDGVLTLITSQAAVGGVPGKVKRSDADVLHLKDNALLANVPVNLKNIDILSTRSDDDALDLLKNNKLGLNAPVTVKDIDLLSPRSDADILDLQHNALLANVPVTAKDINTLSTRSPTAAPELDHQINALVTAVTALVLEIASTVQNVQANLVVEVALQSALTTLSLTLTTFVQDLEKVVAGVESAVNGALRLVLGVGLGF